MPDQPDLTDLPDPLVHHGDAEVGDGLLDFAVNVYAGPRPLWLDAAMAASLAEVGAYPSAGAAEAALAARHGRPSDQVLATAGAAEAFSLVAGWAPNGRAWRRPVVVHPQFTEPHAALEAAGHRVTSVVLAAPYGLDPALVPHDADLVVLGNPTNPSGVLHPRAAVVSLLRPGRVVLVDEAFMDCVAGEHESLAGAAYPGLIVVRSLTKHWGVPGVRAGCLLAAPDVVAELRRLQTPWSVSTTAAAVMVACSTPEAAVESRRRAEEIAAWRAVLRAGLRDLGLDQTESAASFVLARVGPGAHARLRAAGVACRRCDTFPGLDETFVRIAVRPPDLTGRLLGALAVALD